MSEDGRKRNGKPLGSKNKVQGEIVGENLKFSSRKEKNNKHQSQTLEDFLKRREGESFEQWEKRTSRKRLVGVKKNNKISIAKSGKVHIMPEKLKGMDREKQIWIANTFLERPYDFLENYAFIMRWASVRYGILKDDIEIAFYFYNKGAFTFEDFNRVCVQLGTVRGLWSRWTKKPYITPLQLVTQEGVVKQIEHYQLTSEFLRLLRAVYGALTKMNKLTLTARTSANYKREKVSPELNEFLEQLNREIDDVINGKEKTKFFIE